MGFRLYYTTQDAQLLAELDELHGTPCEAAAKKLCESNVSRLWGCPF
ncbi:MAG: hypothetical protein KZQ60_01040 [Candidatus Thiodiazotropha sp. (ex Lucinoma aequizonata)]|nr:hypothetical protein [Candidatus Thiodiazotropha sp. (ex Lucinoma aequizonata)]